MTNTTSLLNKTKEETTEKTVEKKTIKSARSFFSESSISNISDLWLQAPNSTDSTVIYSWDKKLKEYSQDEFIPKCLENRLGFSDILTVLMSLKSIPNYDIKGYMERKQYIKFFLQLIPI